ncbi:angiotensin-converting enzyme-like [Ptychodera flava]|uniref:angiotensin-converting enzyme-like n=1 Tax=Ptychodera flava TaxID=63121 RepID=UPI00396A524C
MSILLWFCCILLSSVTVTRTNSITDEDAAQGYLAEHNSTAEEVYYTATVAAWNFNTNLTDYNNEVMINESIKASEFDLLSRGEVEKYNWTSFSSDTKRQLEKIYYIGSSALEDDDLLRYNQVLSEMETIYSTATVCEEDDPHTCYYLEPGLTEVMANERDYNRLVWAWNGWRNSTGPHMKDLYEEFVDLANQAALENDQPDMGAYWRSWYEVDDLESDVLALWKDLLPLYEQLHAFVRGRLARHYGEEYVSQKGGIPAHLLGNMWAQQWNNILDLVTPYPDKPTIDVTDEMNRQGYDVDRMFSISEEFFVSLGLKATPDEFWEYSMLTKPDDGRDVVCHASAWDFSNRKDFRIKMCTEVNMEDLLTIHHEMGHIQYYLQYKHQPVIYRGGANPGFHEAVGDVLALSVSTPEHLHEIGLLEEVVDDYETDINFLMSMALEKIAFLPFGLLMDLWRWEVFEGKVTKENYNERWWQLRNEYQGVVPPVPRSDLRMDFDPGSKYHIPANTPYIRYFVSFVIQFQFHEALCKAANNTRELHRCDIYRSHEAGQLLSDMLSLGESLPWPEAMQRITGKEEMDVAPLIQYFQPLIDWLKDMNEKEGNTVGWDNHWRPPADEWIEPFCAANGGRGDCDQLCTDLGDSFSCSCFDGYMLDNDLLTCIDIDECMEDVCDKICFNEEGSFHCACPAGEILDGDGVTCLSDQIADEALAEDFLTKYNDMAQGVYFAQVLTEWDYNTDVANVEKQNQMLEQSLITSAFEQEARTNASKFDRSDFEYDTNRQLEKLLYIGSSALEDEEELQKYNELQAEMETIYSVAKVCELDDENTCYPLEPDLVNVMATERDYERLLWAWNGWRDATGPYMIESYEEFVELSNKAAEANDQDDMGAYWRSWYEVDNLEADVMQLWGQIRPLYVELHTYVRRRLSQVYGQENVDLDGAIPAHLLGNMWAQSWGNIIDLVVPYPDKPSIDVTDALVEQNYTAIKIFELTDQFFIDLGMEAVPDSFWTDSMLEKPDDREVVCHASAWDFYNGKDFRVKQCTEPTMDHLITAHHEMGHIQYFLQYKDKPVVYRDGANPGFHEAVGDVMALSVSTPEHLSKIGLLDNIQENDYETDINFLMSMALEKVAFLPFGLIIDLWRWRVFSGDYTPDNYNDKWWDLRLEYQGVAPPTARHGGDFDPGAKYHVPANVPYIRYFVSHVIQFQFHKAACNAANVTRPLHRCDIDGSEAAGRLLSDMLMKGSSVPWPEAMEAMTGTREMDAEALFEYFQPLYEWLKLQNDENGDNRGWDKAWRPPEYLSTGKATMSSSMLLFLSLYVSIVLFNH